MSDAPGRGSDQGAQSMRFRRTRPRAWETVALSLLLGVPPALLTTFWLSWRVRDQRARALSPDGDVLFDPHGFLLVSGSVLLLGLCVLAGLVLIPWTVRLARRRARAAWIPVALNAVALLPLPGLVFLVLFLVAAPLRL